MIFFEFVGKKMFYKAYYRACFQPLITSAL